MAVKTEKVLTHNLTIGMYVSALDRPWLKTDYLLEGFYIETIKDIEKLERLCQFVYIDVDLTRANSSTATLRAQEDGYGTKDSLNQQVIPATIIAIK